VLNFLILAKRGTWAVNEIDSGAGSAAPGATTLSHGELLRAAREHAGWTQARLAAELCLPIDRLRALERGDNAAFGGVVFIRGYLRRAAILLGVSPQYLLTALESCCEGARPADVRPGPAPGQLPGRGAPGWAGPFSGIAAILGAVAATWWLMEAGEEAPRSASTHAPSAAATLEFVAPAPPRVVGAGAIPQSAEVPGPAHEGSPETGLPATVAEALAIDTPPAEPRVAEVQQRVGPVPGTVELRFEFREDCWLEVIDAEDRRLAYRLHQAGDVVRLQGTAPVSVFLGNAEGVRLTVDGAPMVLRPARSDGTARLTVGGGAG
jgi:cytoskeleton protein RodZ